VIFRNVAERPAGEEARREAAVAPLHRIVRVEDTLPEPGPPSWTRRRSSGAMPAGPRRGIRLEPASLSGAFSLYAFVYSVFALTALWQPYLVYETIAALGMSTA